MAVFWGNSQAWLFLIVKFKLNLTPKFMFENTKFESILHETQTEFMWLGLRMSLGI